jgi:site-specific recombinase XerD
MEGQQLPLFEGQGDQGAFGPPVSRQEMTLTGDSSLAATMGGFHDHMIRQGYTENTIRAFLSDLRILTRYLGPGRAVGSISTKDLDDFLTYLRHYRGKPCSPKSYARRVTTLKALFGWLAKGEIIPRDPAAPIVQEHVGSPLPHILYADQIQRLLITTRRLVFDPEDPDPRPHLLVSLLLKTGIKKGEAMRIRLNDIDLSDPQGAAVYIRYASPRQLHKERKLRLPEDFTPTLARYRDRYQPQERLFECTARNLEYVLDDVAERADLPQGVSFEMLRWTAAVQDHRAGMRPDRLRQKLGLSEITWRDTFRKIKMLAGPAL